MLDLRGGGGFDSQSKWLGKWQPKITLEELQWLVATNAKQRFELQLDEVSGRWKIRATQGHTMKQVQDDSLLMLITSATDYPVVYHGTYSAHFDKIIAPGQGLKTMGRNHIHFTTAIPRVGEEKRVISGMRSDADIAIAVDVRKAMDDGIVFYRSTNGVVLTTGVKMEGEIDGLLSKKYFSDVIELKTGRSVTRPWSCDA